MPSAAHTWHWYTNNVLIYPYDFQMFKQNANKYIQSKVEHCCLKTLKPKECLFVCFAPQRTVQQSIREHSTHTLCDTSITSSTCAYTQKLILILCLFACLFAWVQIFFPPVYSTANALGWMVKIFVFVSNKKYNQRRCRHDDERRRETLIRGMWLMSECVVYAAIAKIWQ